MKHLSDILEHNDTDASRKLLQELEQSFMHSYEYWYGQYEMSLKAIRFVKEPTYDEFCKAILQRAKWFFSAKLIEPMQFAMDDVYTLALQDLSHPNNPNKYLVVKNQRAWNKLVRVE